MIYKKTIQILFFNPRLKKIFLFTFFSLLFIFLTTKCSTFIKTPIPPDQFLWLEEEIKNKNVLSWVEKQNTKTLNQLAKGKDFKSMSSEILKILEAKDKIPSVFFRGKYLYNVLRNDQYVRGLLRRTSYKSFQTNQPQWESVLDIDALAKKENENWIFNRSRFNCLETEYRHCLIYLSRGGKDASVIREFDMVEKKFVQKGFVIPEAKTLTAWADYNHLIIGTDFGKDSLTQAGYPRVLKLWKRNTPLKQAKTLLEVSKDDFAIYPLRMSHQNNSRLFMIRRIDFQNQEIYSFNLKTKSIKTFAKPSPLPSKISLLGYFKGFHILMLKTPLKLLGKSYHQGDLIALSISENKYNLFIKDAQLIFSPQPHQAFETLRILKNKIVFSLLEDVKGKLFYTEIKNNQWQNPIPFNFTFKGEINLTTATDEKDLFFYTTNSFNQPTTLFSYELNQRSPIKLKTLPHRFNAKNLIIRQKFSVSKDGTKIPYFIVHKKDIQYNRKNPTLLYGYGGFGLTLTPYYSATLGKFFFEKGGVYVLANIRGGGEYGPKWHQAALKENRQRSHDDFISIAEDLIQNKITSRKHLAISGGSQGGLLVGVAMTQRPDLFRSAMISVPLLDMIRYTKLLTGPAWIAEYGNPDKPKERKFLLKYSPYQNILAKKKYPKAFIHTSSLDDRVHPGHGRKMTAKMLKQGHDVLYYENHEGGHGSAANLKQLAKIIALRYQFLYQTIF